MKNASHEYFDVKEKKLVILQMDVSAIY